MNNIFKELPIVFPFYENHKQKDINKENVESICAFKLISPKNALLPFQIEIPKDKANPISWKIIGINGSEISIVCHETNMGLDYYDVIVPNKNKTLIKK